MSVESVDLLFDVRADARRARRSNAVEHGPDPSPKATGGIDGGMNLEAGLEAASRQVVGEGTQRFVAFATHPGQEGLETATCVTFDLGAGGIGEVEEGANTRDPLGEHLVEVGLAELQCRKLCVGLVQLSCLSRIAATPGASSTRT